MTSTPPVSLGRADLDPDPETGVTIGHPHGADPLASLERVALAAAHGAAPPPHGAAVPVSPERVAAEVVRAERAVDLAAPGAAAALAGLLPVSPERAAAEVEREVRAEGTPVSAAAAPAVGHPPPLVSLERADLVVESQARVDLEADPATGVMIGDLIQDHLESPERVDPER